MHVYADPTYEYEVLLIALIQTKVPTFSLFANLFHLIIELTHLNHFIFKQQVFVLDALVDIYSWIRIRESAYIFRDPDPGRNMNF